MVMLSDESTTMSRVDGSLGTSVIAAAGRRARRTARSRAKRRSAMSVPMRRGLLAAEPVYVAMVRRTSNPATAARPMYHGKSASDTGRQAGLVTTCQMRSGSTIASLRRRRGQDLLPPLVDFGECGQVSEFERDEDVPHFGQEEGHIGERMFEGDRLIASRRG